MVPSLLTISLRKKRDLVRSRQRARQIAGLLGFDAREQMEFAAAVFELARVVQREERCGRLRFRLGATVIRVEPVQSNLGLCLEKPVDEARFRMSREDLVWAVRELDHGTPLNVFEEMEKQNQELLTVLGELLERRQLSRSAAA